MLFKKRKEVDNDRSGIVVADNPTSIVSEQYRTIRTNIQFSMIDQKLKTLLVTSATPNSGKTTTSVNLAAAFASEGTKVLIVSTDMRKPRMHKVFNVPNNVGLTNLLTNWDLNLQDVVKESNVHNLYHLQSGPVPPNPADLLNSNRMQETIEEMKENFDLVIFDSPPILAVTDAQILATKVDGTIVIIPEGRVSKKELDETMERLNNVKANVLGSVMNMVEIDADSYYYYYGEE